MKKVLHNIYSIIRKIFNLLPVGNIILFESHNDYDGNSGALYQYLIKNNYGRKYKMVWAVRNFDNVPKEDKNCIVIKYNGHSLKNLYYESRAKFVFFDNRPPVTKKKKKRKRIYLTHACPPLKNSKKYINVDNYCDYCLCTSKNIVELISDQFNANINKLFLCGLPRNDNIKISTKEIEKICNKKYDKVVLWMPTFRKAKFKVNGNSRNDSTIDYYLGLPTIKKEEDLEKLNDELNSKNIYLIIKFHPGAFVENIHNKNYSNILLLTADDVKKYKLDMYKLLADTDALISDYSSITFDYMKIDKPIGYIIDDIDEYKLGFPFDNVLEFMPGEHIKNNKELLAFFNNINKDLYKKERKKIYNYICDYPDDKNCERIAKMFLD